jgi:DNA repair exonuclease SbcCD ATPase subunit
MQSNPGGDQGISYLENQVKDLKAELSDVSQEREQLFEELRRAGEKQNSQEFKSNQQELETMIQDSEQLKMELAISKQTIEDLLSMQSNPGGDQGISYLENQVKDLKAELLDVSQEREQLFEELCRASEQQNSHAQNGSDELSEELERHKLQAKALIEKASQLENSNKQLQSDLEYHSGVAEDALKQVDEYEEEILALRQQDKSAEIASIQQQLRGSGADPRLEELETLNDQLMDKIASLSEKLGKQDANRFSMNPAMLMNHSQSQTQINELTDQLEEAIQKLDTLQTEKFMLIDQLEDLKDYNQMLQQSLQSIKK